MLILKLLAAYFALGIEPDPPEGDPPEGDPPAGDPPDDDLPDPLEGEGEGEGDPPDEDDPAALRAQLAQEKAAREKAEREHREASDRHAAEQRARAQPPAQSEEQRIFEQEEAILKDPNSTEQQRYWVNANRTLRANQRESREALRTSREMADKADYDRLAATSPLAKKYSDRVEKKLAEMRASGNDLPRRLVLKFIVGDDIVEGKVKTSKKPAAAPAGEGDRKPAAGARVPRGSPAQARSDVRARGATTERDKRRQRLDGQII